MSIAEAEKPKGVPAKADIVVVGAGVSGLYCAWRLLRQQPDRKVVILEKIGRTGGRLDTDRVHLKSQGKVVEVKDEEGAMRFNLEMTELIELAHELGLDKHIVPFGSGGDNNRYYLRGHSFTRAEAADNVIWGELYALEEKERGLSPGQLIGAVYLAILAQNGCPAPANPTPEFWQRFRNEFSYNGIKLNAWGLWSLLRTFGYSQECINLLKDTVGFAGPFQSESNAGDAIQILEDFPSDPAFHAFDQGFTTLVDALVAELGRMKATICIGVTVAALEQAANGAICMRWQSTPDVFPGPLKHGSVDCKQVILALPKNAILPLAADSPLLKADDAAYQCLRKNLDASVGMVLTKVNLYYNNAWWRDGTTGRPPIADGASFTDLPADSFYVFDPIIGESATGPAPLTLYCDFDNADFWQEMQEIGPAFDSPLQAHHNKQIPQVLFPASQAVVDEMTRQLKDVFSTNAVPVPVLTSYRRWGDGPFFGYAYHQWGRGADDSVVIPALAKPIPSVEVYTCGESCSDQQGWVNGALRSAEIVLTKHFGMASIVPAGKLEMAA